mmetsp:Transcript_59450/g.174014  ORF Transcript_59450/g.174014 Transcript_59450/m.174014 type:complete len:203 (-) Transcript_59450:1949-2557(-)
MMPRWRSTLSRFNVNTLQHCELLLVVMLHLLTEAGGEACLVCLKHAPEKPQTVQGRHNLVVPVIPQRLRPGEGQPHAQRRQGQHRARLGEAGRLEGRVRCSEGHGNPWRSGPWVSRRAPVEEPVVERQNTPSGQRQRADVLEVLRPSENVADLRASSISPAVSRITPSRNNMQGGTQRCGIRHRNPQGYVPGAPILAEAVDG